VIAEVISSEEQAYKMYSDLANLAENEEIKKILTSIALEEKTHKDILITDLSIETNL
jgi:rubrerythrin